MVEAVHHPTLHLISIFHVYKVFWYNDMLWMGTWVHPYADTPLQVEGDYWKIEVQYSQSDAVMSWLRL